ncbi:MAG: tetratricopeptide repeat protein, partial [Kiritimatiellaeota bacterium]|nr:tetratricopeptide repeat protein [Kiritimatiellota bacterium]
VARDFLSVFEGVQVWCMGTTDWLLLGGRQEIRVAMDDMLELFERDDVFNDWMRAGNMGLPEILACMVCDRGGLEKWIESRGAEGARAAEWRASRRVIEGDHFLALMMESARREGGTDWVLQGEMDEEIYEGMMRRVEEARDARALAVRALTESYAGRPEESLAAAKAAAKVTPRDALLQQMVDGLDMDAQRLLKIRNYHGGRAYFENLIALSGGGARYHHGLGICLRATGDLENAYRHFARAVGGVPEQVAFRLDLAKAAVTIGEFDEADRQYREMLKREPDNAAVHLLFAQALTAQRRPDKDFEQAIQLAERACTLTEWKDANLAYALADIYIEAGRVLEGMGLKRRLREQTNTH